MRQDQISREELERFQRENPNASLAEYINQRNAEIKQKLGMADSRPDQTGSRRFLDDPNRRLELADVEPARPQTVDASGISGGGC